ncbi:hypothetical protein [Burkholderia diffusa]|uniref:hypothetical protein n=1 Tax=Burkholderia diffusa TaxID=488732 RepID=UPI00158CE45B|nr:hypothetical protein [Burkholderia diffusa]
MPWGFDNAAWDETEPLPKALINIGNSGRFLLKGPIDQIGKEVAFSCDQEIARVRANSCQAPPSGNVDLNQETLAALTQELDLWTDGSFSDELASVARARKSGNELFMRCPLAWAVDRLTLALANGSIEIGGGDEAAILYLTQWRHLSARWKHHQLFKEVIAPALCNEYHHTIALLTCCSYLSDHGNDVGITRTKGEVGKSPDLYVNVSPNQRVSIEIKAPDALHWPKSVPLKTDIARRIEEQLKAAAKQITGNAGGVVVIGTNHIDPGLADQVRDVIEDLATRKRISSKITVVASVCAHGSIEVIGDHSFKPYSASTVNVTQNPKFAGKSFVRT